MFSEDMLENANYMYAAIFAAGAFLAYYWMKPDDKEEELFKFKTMNPTVVNNQQDVGGGDIISRMKAKGRNILILYGSQTGTAEDFSSTLSKEAQRYENMKAMAVDPEDIELEDLSRLNEIENSVLVFCVATYGEGDPTDNLQTTHDWLNDPEREEDQSFENINFAVFGLGNKTYENYNTMGKYFDKRLSQLGGSRLLDLGLGDDDGNIEEDFNSWKENFWSAICKKFNVSRLENQGTIRNFELKANPRTDRVFTGEVVRFNSYKNQRPPFDAKNPFLAQVKVNRELHNGGDRSCMHIEFDLTDSKIRYEAGDHLAIYPTNDTEAVNSLGKILNVDLDEIFSLQNIDEDSSKKFPFPCPTTFRTALTHYVDIHSPPRVNLLNELIQYCDGDAKDQLIKLCGTAGADVDQAKELYQKWVVDSRRSIVHVLEDLNGAKNIPIDHLLELLPRLQPRYYSIASSPKSDPNSVAVCAILVKYKSLAGRINQGVATAFMKNKIPNDSPDIPNPTVPCYVRRSQFKLPFRPLTPIIMVGPGTGFAPFRGFLQHRKWQKDEGREVGATYLFTGCRNKAIDYIYEDELEQYSKSGVLTDNFVAFSRDTEKKVYVQHILKEKKQLVWDCINKNGNIYVCGDAKNMARDVNDIIVEIISEFKQVPTQGAIDFVKSLRNKGRYQEDVWS